jgi:hypothetical protein
MAGPSGKKAIYGWTQINFLPVGLIKGKTLDRTHGEVFEYHVTRQHRVQAKRM